MTALLEILIPVKMDNLERFDNVWSCFVCLASFIVGMFCFGIHNSYGIIHVTVVRQFNAKSVESGMFIIVTTIFAKF